jgi:hypothetical protein
MMWVPAAQDGNKVAVDSAEIEDLLKEYKLVSKVRGRFSLQQEGEKGLGRAYVRLCGLGACDGLCDA